MVLWRRPGLGGRGCVLLSPRCITSCNFRDISCRLRARARLFHDDDGGRGGLHVIRGLLLLGRQLAGVQHAGGLGQLPLLLPPP